MKINNLQHYYLNKFQLIFGDQYDYSKSIILNSFEKIIVACKIHGEFSVAPNNHLNRKSGCPRCKNIDVNFIKICKDKYNNFYDYSLVNYVNNRTSVEIICPIHGNFFQLPMNHKNGSICPTCSINRRKYSIDDLIKEGNETFNFKYGYDCLHEDFIDSQKKVRIICPIHGVFEQNIFSHFKRKYGCLKCKPVSKGANEVLNYLEEKFSGEYSREKTFPDCKNIQVLYFDFYLKKYNLCIEYNGRQHYMPISYFGGQKGFEKQVINDNIKRKYCKLTGITLCEISYEENIKQKLDKLFYDGICF